MLKTLCIFGTRPEAIKMAPIIQALQNNENIENKICITGQHQHMLQPVFDFFEIKSDFNLRVMTLNQGLSVLTSKILLGLEGVFKVYKPAIVLVHGDTTSTLAATLSAYYHRIPVAHVEAGLRTGDLFSPWPEEANRKLTGHIANFHFSPTHQAKLNLLREGISEEKIFITGNTVIDALYVAVNKLNYDHVLHALMRKKFSFLNKKRKVILVTGHRRENFGKGFQQICLALLKLAENFPQVDIVYSVHLNPNVQQPVRSFLSTKKNIYLIDPVDYLPFVYLMKSAYLILTDSGGIQEEAPSLGKPVLVMREMTERPEAVEAGTVKLVGADTSRIVNEVSKLLNDENAYQQMSAKQNPYGDGKASTRIVKAILKEMRMKTPEVFVEEMA